MLSNLRHKIDNFPTKSGCYLMKNKNGEILYVGKAKNLRMRALSYFNGKNKGTKTHSLLKKVTDIDFQLTDSEAEALILENNLIKKHTPKYNILMRDDKSYPYIVLDKSQPFPRLTWTRKIERKSKDNEREIFGPFAHGSNITEVLRIITKSFQLRDCSLREFKSRKVPCLLYQIMQCSAPCTDYISPKEYNKNLELAADFFRGKADESMAILEERMLTAAAKEEFELAAIIRDYIDILGEFIHTKQQGHAEIFSKHKSVDIFSYYQGDIETDISIYLIREGILLGHKSFYIPSTNIEQDIEESIVIFLLQYYTQSKDTPPQTVFSPLKTGQQKLFKEALNNVSKIKVARPTQEFKPLMAMTKDHSREQQRVRLTNQDRIEKALKKLQTLTKLSAPPVFLECYDIAIFQGSSPTASQVVFKNGMPDKKLYRHYKLKSRPEGNNDFAMIQETVQRRLKKGDLPDLFIVDGGKGQVSAFAAVLKENSLSTPVIGVAKGKTKAEGDKLIIQGRVNSYSIKKFPPLFRLITHVRDESHRFARRLHHKHEKGRVITSWLDQVEGIGPKRKKQILSKLNLPINTLSQMSAPDIAKHLSVSQKIAASILKVLQEID